MRCSFCVALARLNMYITWTPMSFLAPSLSWVSWHLINEFNSLLSCNDEKSNENMARQLQCCALTSALRVSLLSGNSFFKMLLAWLMDNSISQTSFVTLSHFFLEMPLEEIHFSRDSVQELNFSLSSISLKFGMKSRRLSLSFWSFTNAKTWRFLINTLSNSLFNFSRTWMEQWRNG